MLLDKFLHPIELPSGKSVVLGKAYDWLKPELGLAFRGLHVHVQSFLFAREEVEAVSSFKENRWAHALTSAGSKYIEVEQFENRGR
jgi:hypothetical protein